MMAGARMNTARKVSPLHVPRKRGCQRILAITVCATMTHSAMERKHGGAGNCVSKLSTWLPKWLRLTVTSKPPMSCWPPCF